MSSVAVIRRFTGKSTQCSEAQQSSFDQSASHCLNQTQRHQSRESRHVEFKIRIHFLAEMKAKAINVEKKKSVTLQTLSAI